MKRLDYDLFKAPFSTNDLNEQWPMDFTFVQDKIAALRKEIIQNPPQNGHPRTFSPSKTWSHSGTIPGWKLVQPIFDNTIFPLWHSVKGSNTKLKAADAALILSHAHNVHVMRADLYQDVRLATFREELFELCTGLFQHLIEDYEPWHNAPHSGFSSTPLLENAMQSTAEREKLHTLLVQKHQKHYCKILSLLRQPGTANFPMQSTSLSTEMLEELETHSQEILPFILWVMPGDLSDVWEDLSKVWLTFFCQIFVTYLYFLLFRSWSDTTFAWKRRF